MTATLSLLAGLAALTLAWTVTLHRTLGTTEPQLRPDRPSPS